jgi:hypothetical protein
MKVNRRFLLMTSAGWVGTILFVVTLIFLVWSMRLVAQFIASLAMMAFVIMLAILFQEYIEWVEGQMNAVGLEDELADLGWGPLPTELKMKAHAETRESTREVKIRKAGGDADNFPDPTPQPTPPPRVGPDLTASFDRWKSKMPDQPGLTDLVAQVTGEPESEVESEPPSEDEAEEIVKKAVEKYPFLPRPEGLE